MNENRIGQFIAELRKEKKITQKDLATQLHITDKAVSKWERGLSCPDIVLLTSIADILGVTTSELLNGEKNSSVDAETTVDNVLNYAEKTVNKKIVTIQNIVAISFSLVLLLGVITCSICDMAISHGFTWSLYPISTSIFVWLISIPVIKFGKKGIMYSLISLSVFIIPFILVLNAIIEGKTLLVPIGIRMSLITVVFLWLVYLIFRFLKNRILVATAISLLLIIPLCLIINVSLSIFISEPFIDIWDMIAFGAVIIGAVILLIIESVRKKRMVKE